MLKALQDINYDPSSSVLVHISHVIRLYLVISGISHPPPVAPFYRVNAGEIPATVTA